MKQKKTNKKKLYFVFVMTSVTSNLKEILNEKLNSACTNDNP